MKKTLLHPFIFLFSIFVSAQFGPENHISKRPSGASSTYAADLDNDGDLEVLSASHADGKIAWYENLTINNCHPDLDALLALYNSTDGPNWSNNTGWADGANGTNCLPCEWFGVDCDEDDRVVSLILINNQLSGSIPPDLGNLSNLTYISFSGNHLTGSIPEELGNLLNLIQLRLHLNQLSGSIPPALSNLSNLTNLW